MLTSDVNECEEIEVPCTGNHVCVNTIGDYRCTLGKRSNFLSWVYGHIIIPLTDPTILIIIIICASGGLALMCITPIIILVTCFYYRRKRGDMKHSTSYDNLIPEEEPDLDEDMYKHLKEEEELKKRRGVGVDIERRISLLEREGLVDDLLPTKKDTAVSYIDEVDENVEKEKENQNNLFQKSKESDEEEKKDITYIDAVEPDDKPKNELKEKWKSAKRHSIGQKDDSLIEEEASDSDKTKLIQKPNNKKSGPVKPINEDQKEDLSHIDEVDTDDKTKKVQRNYQQLEKPKEGDKFKHRRVDIDIKRRIRELQDTKGSDK